MKLTPQTIPPPILFLSFALLMRMIAPIAPQIMLPFNLRLGMVGLIVALAIIFGVGGLLAFKRARTTTSPFKGARAAALVTTGVYRFSRNPMYLALALLLVALVFWLQAPLLFIGVAGFIWTMNHLQIRAEENALQRLFGKAYQDYQARVCRWL
ncbi:isoprenylcysteine carboxylmethyltransferase family protein [Suttonella sp. R2A3]|uniref:methyltransferase family protein n=1 Tax=Suttonella sp. R2A3 TaxID=2908648 RepID=UPI001F26E6A7|nr:isoprenylcysteine carboxylmethyltransferase family protein [Suttonella sp. R2A3]UJF24279.1 isoprenylcysteine carboxylmethyltransferase family protein [Suttonella sp. R2A3]